MLLIAYRRAFIYLIEASFLIASFGVYSLFDFLRKYTKYAHLIFIPLMFVVFYEPLFSHNLYSGLLKYYISDENYADLLWIRDNLPNDSVILATPEISTAIYPIAHKYVADYAFAPDEDLERLLRYPCSYKGVKDENDITHIYRPENPCVDIQLVSNGVYIYID
jgi:hypothetical protein